MTLQEQQVLENFLRQLTQTRGISKDAEANNLIMRTFAEQPDAPYLVVQRALLLEQALNSAKAQIAELQQRQVNPTPTNSNFLNSNAWGNAEPVSSSYNVPSSTFSTQQQTSRPGFFSGSGGSFLGTMAATAAGVAGGAFLFQGIESLFGHHGGNGLFEQNPSGHLTENTTVNNTLSEAPSNQLLADSSDSLVDDNFDLGSSVDDDLSSF